MTNVKGEPIDPEVKELPFKPHTTTGRTFTTIGEEEGSSDGEVSIEEFNFEDELEQDSYYLAYQFIQSIQPNYLEDMQGNQRYCLNMNHVRGRLRMFWVLLDNQSTIHIFWNTMFLVNVRKIKRKVELHTNAGSIIIDEVGELPGVGTVWVHQEGIANIYATTQLRTHIHWHLNCPGSTRSRWTD
mmetsp:Transcript_13563/g.31684  ORF Transcript_13563/g.31684 Transcript_13563/m.31684 type:complete len:185 (-) Transcript_13563:43-597(-)